MLLICLAWLMGQLQLFQLELEEEGQIILVKGALIF